MSELFPLEKKPEKRDKTNNPPLADRMRPEKFFDLVGQEHLLSEGAPLQKFFESGSFPSMIFWGPPGVGKTTIALMIADAADYHFEKISAVDSGVKEVRRVISAAEKRDKLGGATLLFIDEIHRFNKAQQDALLGAVERGLLVLVGATTENPSFEINSALLSRMQVYRLYTLSEDNIRRVVARALEEDEILSKYDIEIKDWDFLFAISSGDARSALNALELAFKTAKTGDKKLTLDREVFEKSLQQKTAYYDKKGESHYDTISAFIKSLRGSDPDAAMFWLAKMLAAGEDPKFISRRMVIFASEDVGNADPFALTHAISVFRAVEIIGLPEAAINLAHGVSYLASAPKSNASYLASKAAQADVEKGVYGAVPMHLRNAPAKLMRDEGYSKGYKYPHDYDGHFVEENYFPENAPRKAYYKPTDIADERNIKGRLRALWKERYEE